MERLTHPRRFVLVRSEDISGVSGVGIVAHGCDFGSKTILYWLGEYATLGVYDSIEALLAIHGHEGRTWVEWLDHHAGQTVDTRRPKLIDLLLKMVRIGGGGQKPS